MGAIEVTDGGIIANVHAQPRASKDEARGEIGGAIKIRLRAPPVDGKANKALIEFLAETLGVPRSAVSVLSGETARRKRVRILGVTAQEAAARLAGHRR